MAHRPIDDRARRLVAEAAREVTRDAVDPVEDARAERARATFDSHELACFMVGGEDRLRRRAELAKVLAAQPWGNKDNRYFLTREQEYVGGLKAAVGIWNLMREKKYTLDDAIDMRTLLFFPGGLELHIGMFIPTLLSQGSPEQQAKWMPLARSLKIIGTYAQTEIGHGTFVRGLETVAVFDEDSDEFVVHSPTLTSTKWWPGGMGKTATHVVLMARLFTKGQDRGVHSFVVQIRDLDTHLPMPGVDVGDIGPKLGFLGVDNGFLRFDHVRIPRDALLARFSRVDRDGAYTPPPAANAKASYATMVYVRATIVRDAGEFLGRAATIATRFTAIRRQTQVERGRPETQVLDYDNVSQALLPLVAQSYGLTFMGRAMMGMYEEFEEGRNRGDFASLPELHALSSGLKAACTDIAASGIETCRRQCGGHGYSALSGLPNLLASYVQNVTWEGDNNVMYLQAARFLLKSLAAAQSGASGARGSAAYLAAAAAGVRSARSGVREEACWADPQQQLAALRQAAGQVALSAVEALRAAGGGQVVFEGDPWNNTTVDLIRLAKAHTAVVLHQTFVDTVGSAEVQRTLSGPTLAVLRTLCALHGISLVSEWSSELLEGGFINARQAALLRAAKRGLVRALRPQAVALVDGLGHEDYKLNSALGRSDGDIYTALLDMAKRSPLNATQEGPAWAPVLRDLLSPSARSAGARSRL